MSDINSDEYLLQSLIDGDREGILAIYRILFPKVNNYVLNNDGNQEDARDVLQMALMQVAMRAKAADFTLNSTFVGYLFTVSKNVWRREKKMQKLKVTNEEVRHLRDKEQDIIHAALEQEKWELFQEKLQAISENCRNILTYFFSKMNYNDIAKQLGYANENVVRQRIFKCKKKLKELIQADARYKEIKGQ